jgi:2-hydroxycyclohexanecarboxyl-CoA dehydrogenase
VELDLAGQTAVVVGAARGIGRAIALAFAEEQANVMALDRDPEVTAVAAEIARRGHSGRAEVVDATDLEGVRRLAQEAEASIGNVHHVVYAVGAGSGKFGFPFWNLDPGDWARVLEVNVIGAVNVAHAFAPALTRAGEGSLLFLGSVAGQIGSQTDPPYSAAKAALINFAQCAARDLAPHNVRVNTLCPGMVRTALNRSVWEAWARRQPPEGQMGYDEWAVRKIAALVPLNRWQEPEDVAAMAVFLASARGKNITGQAINVDGGYVMHS